MKPPAPIALFVYNRIAHTQLTVAALQQNILSAETELIVISDGAKGEFDRSAVQEVRSYCATVTGFKSVRLIEREHNYGLAQSVIDGVSSIIETHKRVIVVEDDLITSRYFLEYMNDALNVYENDSDVISIHGYRYPVGEQLPETFFIRGADCWGWATWERGWKLFNPDSQHLFEEIKTRNLEYSFDWDGNYRNVRMLEKQIAGTVDSWAIRWHASAFLNNKLTLYPGESLINNIGGDALATHTKSLQEFQTLPSTRRINVVRQPAIENVQAKAAFVKYFKRIKPTVIDRILRKLTAMTK